MANSAASRSPRWNSRSDRRRRTVIGLGVRGVAVVPQFQVDRQVPRDLPVILEIVGLRPVMQIGIGVGRIQIGVLHIAQHEIASADPV